MASYSKYDAIRRSQRMPPLQSRSGGTRTHTADLWIGRTGPNFFFFTSVFRSIEVAGYFWYPATFKMSYPSGWNFENKFLFSAFDPLGYAQNKVSGWIGEVSKPPKPVLDPPRVSTWSGKKKRFFIIYCNYAIYNFRGLEPVSPLYFYSGAKPLRWSRP